jgi:hypothetical protein
VNSIKLGCIKCSKENDVYPPDTKHIEPRRKYGSPFDDMIKGKFDCWSCKTTNDIY